MRVPRIYQDCHLEEGAFITLNERAHKHLVQVLRINAGRELILFNGEGGEYRAQVIEATKKKIDVKILSFNKIERENGIYIHLFQCISKGDRFEFALQKAVELGVNEITPVFSKRSQLKLNHERKDKKIKHWKQVTLSASEQSGRTQLTQLNEPLALDQLFANAQASDQTEQTIILDPNSTEALSQCPSSERYLLLIGPEGGFDDEELELATHNNFSDYRLGKQILRTETAPIAAIACLLSSAGEF